MMLDYTFRYLDVTKCLPDEITTPRDDWENIGYWLNRVSSKGQSSELGRFSEHGILQVCVLHTKPFQTEHDDQIRTFRDKPDPAVRRCNDRTALVEALADALLKYEQALDNTHQTWRRIVQETPAAMDRIDAAVGLFLQLRGQKALPPQKKRLPNTKTIEQALRTIRDVVAVMTPGAYRKSGSALLSGIETSLRMNCFEQMVAAFRSHTPKMQLREAQRATMAVFQQLGIEQDQDIDRSAARMSRRIRRRNAQDEEVCPDSHRLGQK